MSHLARERQALLPIQLFEEAKWRHMDAALERFASFLPLDLQALSFWASSRVSRQGLAPEGRGSEAEPS